MQIALPVLSIAAIPFTGGASAAGLGASAGLDAADAGFLSTAIGASGVSAGDLSFGTALDAGLGTTASWFGSTIASGIRAAAPIASIGGTVLSAVGANNQGKAQQAEANSEAAQLTQNADEAQASAEQKAGQQDVETAYALSNAQAAAAAGGGSATDPTVTRNLQTIAGQGKFRALTDMYQGNEVAQADLNQAAATKYGGQLQANAGTTKMYSTILSGASSLYDKYGNPTAPPWVTQNQQA